MALIPAMKIGYTISFSVGLVVAFLRTRYLKETIQGEGIGRDVVKIFKGGYSDAFSSIIWTFKNIRGYAAVSMLMASLGSIVLPFWVVFADEVIGLTPYDWGVIMLIGGIAKTIFSLIIGPIVDRIGSRRFQNRANT